MWILRIVSLACIAASLFAIGIFFRKGDTLSASLLIFAAVGFAVAFAWSWTKLVFAPFEWAKRFVEGVEGNERHEWYAFKGQRVRVFLDESRQPWFAVKDIAFILGLKVDANTFGSYASREVGTPEAASEPCLSEAGLRRLIKYSPHRDAGALGLWLDREVLRVLRNRFGGNA